MRRGEPNPELGVTIFADARTPFVDLFAVMNSLSRHQVFLALQSEDGFAAIVVTTQEAFAPGEAHPRCHMPVLDLAAYTSRLLRREPALFRPPIRMGFDVLYDNALTPPDVVVHEMSVGAEEQLARELWDAAHAECDIAEILGSDDVTWARIAAVAQPLWRNGFRKIFLSPAGDSLRTVRSAQ